jgi:CheY-like chemotaxis protein
LGFEPVDTAVDDEVDRDMSGTEYILVVDDEPLQRDLGFRFLSSLGYNVGTAASGEEALLYLEENRVDILILDMIMAPGISGLETYERAIEIVPDLKAIIVSGFAPDNSVKQAIELGLQGFLAKPYSISDLATIVRQALDS